MTTKLPPGVVTMFENQTGDGTSHVLVFAQLPPTTPYPDRQLRDPRTDTSEVLRASERPVGRKRVPPEI